MHGNQLSDFCLSSQLAGAPVAQWVKGWHTDLADEFDLHLK